jgi:hypothetical protein
MVRLVVLHFVAPPGAHHQRDLVDVCFRRHRRDCLIGAIRDELRTNVVLPDAQQCFFGFDLVDSSQVELR